MAKDKKDDDIVTFIHDGRVVSNDPRFKPEDYEGPSEQENTGDINYKQPETVVPPHEEEDDKDSPYKGMTVDELKDELKARQEAGREIDTEGIKKKSQLIAALEADDEA